MNVLVNESSLSAIADSIRGKNGETTKYKPAEMAAAIAAIKTGGSDTPSASTKKAVNFYDYDGTLLHAYTLDEAKALTALPDAPDHSADEIPLTSDGWSEPLEKVTAAKDSMDIAAVYHPADGNLHVIIHNGNSYSDDIGGNQGIALTVPSGCTHIIWGDGTEEDAASGTEVAHKYGEVRVYHVVLVGAKSVNFMEKTYLQSVVIPSSVTRIENGAFDSCYSLQSVVIPSSVTRIENGAFDSCYSLQSVSIPSSVKGIWTSSFGSCRSLQSVVIPSSVTSIESQAFQSCYSLQSVVIPSSVTSIQNYAFQNCYSLQSVVIPSSVTSIQNYAFQSCYSLQSVAFEGETPPKCGAGIFNDTTCPIYAPYANAYKTATNLSAYADRIYGYHREHLSAIIINGADIINAYEKNATEMYTVQYNENNNAYAAEHGATWSVSGNATISADGDTCTLTLADNAAKDDVITLTATSTYDSSIIGRKEITCDYVAQTVTIDTGSGQWADSGKTVDGHALYQSVKSYHVGNGEDICTLTFSGFRTATLKCRSNGESDYDYLEVGPIDGTVSREASGNLLTLKSKASASDYTDCLLTFPDTDTHTVQVLYSKDDSGDSGEDRGFFYIAKDVKPEVTA